MQVLRHAVRSLWRDRAFSATAVAILGLGVGLTTGIFAVVYAVLLQSPYPEADRLFALEQVVPDLAERYPTAEFPINARHLDEWRTTCEACESLGLLSGLGGANLTGDGPPERIRTLGVTYDLLPTLGVTPSLGRTILAADDEPDAPAVLLLTDGFWRRRYAADPNIVGKDISLNQNPVTVIGVLPPDFEPLGGAYLRQFGSFSADYAGVRPLRLNYGAIRPAGNYNFGAVVRLKPSASPEAATQQMNAALRGFVEEFNREMGVRLRPVDDAVVGNAARGLWLLLLVSGGVLLIACVNVGNLMLVRVEKRSREAAVRRSLGATSARLLRDVLAEGALLGLLSSVSAALIVPWTINALVIFAPPGIPRVAASRADWTALSFAVGLAFVSALLTSVGPALRYRRVQGGLAEAQAGTTAAPAKMTARSLLVAFETGLSAALLIVAILLGNSLFRLFAVDKGFVSENVLAFDLVLPPQQYPSEGAERTDFQDQLLDSLRTQPGVVAVGMSNRLPLEGATWVDTLTPAGSVLPDSEQLVTNFRFVSEDYWRAMGIPLTEGRYLDASDRRQTKIVVSAEAARRLWPGASAMGKQVTWDADEDEPYEVVGIVADVKTGGLRESPVPIGYISYWNLPADASSYSIRTTQDPASFGRVVQDAVARIDPTLPVANLRTMDEISVSASAEQRFQTSLAAALSLVALTLAALGIYGVVSYATARRTKEIGLRMALGAESGRIASMVLAQGMRPILFGLVAGFAVVAAAAPRIESLLFGVSAYDAASYTIAAIVLLTAAAIACYLPVRRATRINPLTALRYE